MDDVSRNPVQHGTRHAVFVAFDIWLDYSDSTSVEYAYLEGNVRASVLLHVNSILFKLIQNINTIPCP